MTEDTYLGKKNFPITLNRYIYANDNPLKYKDPSGNFAPLVAVGVVLGVGLVSGLVTGFVTHDWQQGVKVGLATSAAVGVGMVVGVGAGALVGKLGMTSTVGVSVVSNAVSGLATSLTRDSIGNVWLGEQNDIGKNAIKSTIGGGAFGGINAGLGGVGSSVKGIPNLVKNATITGTSAIGASVTEDIIGNVAFGENNSLHNTVANATLRGATSFGLSWALNSIANRINNKKISEIIRKNDSYDLASYLTSREYRYNMNINKNEYDISDKIRDYLNMQQNNRLDALIQEQIQQNNYYKECK